MGKVPSIRLTAIRLPLPTPPEVVEISWIVRRRSSLHLYVPFDRDIADSHKVEALASSVLCLYEGIEDRPLSGPATVSPQRLLPTDRLTGRCGLAIFCRYLRSLDLMEHLDRRFGSMRKRGKGLT